MSKRPIGRPKTRWEDDVLEDIKSINIGNWKKEAQNRDSWKKVVEQARILYRLQRFIRRKISRSVLLKMRNVSGTNCGESQNTHFIAKNFFF
jgi:hypothetical protein